MTMPQPPAGQGPVDPRGAFAPPPPPPPGMMPPPFYYPPPPPAPRGSFARTIFTTLATSIFGLSIAANVYLLFMTGLLSGGNAQQNVIVTGDPQQKIAVVDLRGLITDGAFTRFDKSIRIVEDDSSVKALVLRVDTPGGTVSASDEIYTRLMQFKEKKKIPVIVSMGGYATSGGYYVSCAADSIVAERTTITGNVGVLLENFNFSKLMDKWGIDDTSMHATGSDFKTAGSQFRPAKPEEQAYLLGLIDDEYATFKAVVKDGRGARLTAPMDVVANGKAYTANESLKMGLIDQIGYAPDAYALAATKAGLTNMHVVHYEAPQSLIETILSGDSKFPVAPSSRNVTVNGLNVNIDSHFLDEFATPRLMYLWRGE